MPPTAEIIQLIVVPQTIIVIPIAMTTGIAVGPGRWISSPAGGGVLLDLAHACT